MDLLAAVLGSIVVSLAGALATAGPASAPSPAVVGQPADRLGYEIVARYPHDDEAWTQGLQLDPSGRLFESTGLLGASTLREVERETGAVLRQVRLPDDVFAEGIALVDGTLMQLTWKNGLAYTWAADTFEPGQNFAYAGEGWGLCHDGERLVMSDGSSSLTFRDPTTFELLDRVTVSLDGGPAGSLNELECVDGQVWANAYLTDHILRIDPGTGRVTGVLDLAGIIELPRAARAGAVLNGIAHDAEADTYLVTGKLWPELIEIRILG